VNLSFDVVIVLNVNMCCHDKVMTSLFQTSLTRSRVIYHNVVDISCSYTISFAFLN